MATLRDTTELRALAGRAEVARERLQLLYDAGVRVGTTLDVTRTARELAEVAVPRFADTVTVDLLETVPRGEEPDRAGRMYRAAVHGTGAGRALPAGEPVPDRTTGPAAQDGPRTAPSWNGAPPPRAAGAPGTRGRPAPPPHPAIPDPPSTH